MVIRLRLYKAPAVSPKHLMEIIIITNEENFIVHKVKTFLRFQFERRHENIHLSCGASERRQN